jgi:hypothetical protein
MICFRDYPVRLKALDRVYRSVCDSYVYENRPLGTVVVWFTMVNKRRVRIEMTPEEAKRLGATLATPSLVWNGTTWERGNESGEGENTRPVGGTAGAADLRPSNAGEGTNGGSDRGGDGSGAVREVQAASDVGSQSAGTPAVVADPERQAI